MHSDSARDITLKVREIHITGQDTVVIFDAQIELIPAASRVEIELLSIQSNDDFLLTDDGVVSAVEYIRQGIEEVLQPRGLGAYVLVSDLVIALSDFHPRRHKRYTSQNLEAVLGDWQKVDAGTGEGD